MLPCSNPGEGSVPSTHEVMSNVCTTMLIAAAPTSVARTMYESNQTRIKLWRPPEVVATSRSPHQELHCPRLLRQIALAEQCSVMPLMTRNDVDERPHTDGVVARRSTTLERFLIEMHDEMNRRRPHDL